MPQIIAPTTAAATYELVIYGQNFNRALIAKGDLGTAVVTVEKQDPDGSWTQMIEDDKPIQLTATSQVLGIYAGLGRIRINKPATTAAVSIWYGA